MSDDLIKRSDAIKAIDELPNAYNGWSDTYDKAYIIGTLEEVPKADRPQGYWTKTDVATYRCSECGKIQIADDVNELNYCCCCGSRNKVRRLKGADDE